MENTVLDEILEIIRSGQTEEEIRELLSDYHEKDIADTLELLEAGERRRLYRILGAEGMAEILAYLEDASDYLEELGLEQAADVLEQMDADDAIDALENVSDEEREQLIAKMDAESVKDIRLISSYDDKEIGSLMTTNYIVIQKNLTVKQAMKELIAQAEDNDNINTIYVEDERGDYYGTIELKDLIVSREHTNLEDIISTAYPYVRATDLIQDCLEDLKQYGEDSIPVLNERNRIIGVITQEDLVELIDEEMGDDYAKLAGLTEEAEADETLMESMRKRMPWLILLLFLGMGVSSVVGIFEGIVSQLALIVCFQSLILDMSGNVGTQSLAVTIRFLMDEQLSSGEKLRFALKEMRIGLMNGLILGMVSFVCIGLFILVAKGKPVLYAFSISGCVGVSLVLAMLISGLVGTLIPMFFHKIHVDPAVASGPLITTVNDLVAVVTYYGLSGIILIQLMHLVG